MTKEGALKPFFCVSLEIISMLRYQLQSEFRVQLRRWEGEGLPEL
jgi:hypothetical protein